MRNKLILLVSLIVLLGFNSCEIREPQIKPDFAVAGKQMFDNSAQNIYDMMRYFDRVLFLDTYKKTPDSLKYIFVSEYFQQYKINNSLGNNWFIMSNGYYSNDTVYSIITDANSIHSTGAIWKIRESYADSYAVISCLSDKKWQIKFSGRNGTVWNINTEINLDCTDSSDPLMFETGNFKITGSGILESVDGYSQHVRINYQVKDTLNHVQNNSIYPSGSIDVTAEDLETNQKESANGRYFINSKNAYKIEITYHGRTQVYQNWIYSD